MLSLALSSWSFHRRLPYFGSGSWSPPQREPALSLLEFPALASSLGLPQIEICQAHLAATEPEYLATVRAAVTAAAGQVINVPIDVGNLAEPDPERRQHDRTEIKRWIDAAAALGAGSVRVNTGHAGEMAPEKALEIVAEGYRELAAYCGQRGMLILLENHGGLSASPYAIMQLVAAVAAPSFRLCPDFGNFAPEARDEGLRAMLPLAAVVHAKVLDRYEHGRHSAFDLDRCLQIVAESGYSGSLSIEFEGKGDAEEGVVWARDHIMAQLGTGSGV